MAQKNSMTPLFHNNADCSLDKHLSHFQDRYKGSFVGPLLSSEEIASKIAGQKQKSAMFIRLFTSI